MLLEGKPLGLLRLLDSTCSLGSAAKDGKKLVDAFTQSHGKTGSNGGSGLKGRTLSGEKAGAGRKGSISPAPPTTGESSYCACGFATAWRKRNGERTTDENFVVLYLIYLFMFMLFFALLFFVIILFFCYQNQFFFLKTYLY